MNLRPFAHVRLMMWNTLLTFRQSNYSVILLVFALCLIELFNPFGLIEWKGMKNRHSDWSILDWCHGLPFNSVSVHTTDFILVVDWSPMRLFLTWIELVLIYVKRYCSNLFEYRENSLILQRPALVSLEPCPLYINQLWISTKLFRVTINITKY